MKANSIAQRTLARVSPEYDFQQRVAAVVNNPNHPNHKAVMVILNRAKARLEAARAAQKDKS